MQGQQEKPWSRFEKLKLSAQYVSLHKSDLFTIRTLANLLCDCGAVVHSSLVFVSCGQGLE